MLPKPEVAHPTSSVFPTQDVESWELEKFSLKDGFHAIMTHQVRLVKKACVGLHASSIPVEIALVPCTR